MTAIPTYEQIVQLPAMFDQPVSDEFIDENGHMNIGDYFRTCSRAIWKVTIAAGLGESYIDKHKQSMFTVEQHMRYYGELRLGERFTVHARLIERSARAIHAMAFVVDQEKRTLACTQEATLVHVSTESRSSVDLPHDVAGELDALIRESDALGWDAPICGAMGLRRK